MGAFIAAAVAFPTVVFTVAVFLFLIYATLKMLGFTLSAIADLFDFIDFDGPEGDGHNFLDTMGVEGVPKTIVFGITSIFAWMASFLGMKYLGWAPWLVGVAALVAGFVLATLVLRPFKPLFAPPQASRKADLVGRPCVIRSTRVDASSGTAEVDDGAAGVLAEVRCAGENSLTVGSKAIVKQYDPDNGTYLVGDQSWT